MVLTRRDLLRQGGIALGAGALLSRFGIVSAMAQTASDDYKALVCIYLGGGNDAYNMVAPYEEAEYSYYRSKRPNIGLAYEEMLPVRPGDPVHGGRSFGLHPGLGATAVPGFTSDGLYPLWQEGKLAVLCNVGTLKYPIDRDTYRTDPSSRPDSLFDHRIQEETWQDLALSQGWGNSIGSLTRQMHTNPRTPMLVNVTGGSAVYLAGTEPYITISNNGANLLVQVGQAGGTLPAPNGSRYSALRQLQLFGMNDNATLVRVVSDKTSKAIDDGEEAFNALAGTTTRVAFPPNNGLATQLAQIARIIQRRDALGTNRRQIFFASLGGFDTHSGQLSAHPVLLRNLSQAMRAFYDELAEQGIADKVTTFTLSEFGRTFQQNSGDPNNPLTTYGTDHAWGSHALVMGDAVRGGWFYGAYPSIEGLLGGPNDVDNGTAGRIIPTTAVDQYAATLAAWFGLRDVDIRAIIPNIDRFSPTNLGFMHSS
jgi:uncharacterized protein (DUF1501 family)